MKPLLNESSDLSKITTRVKFVSDTYRLLVLRPFGFRFSALRKPKAYSIGALAYEYGAEMQTWNPRLHICLMDS